MKAIDVHSHLSTEKGYVFRTGAQVTAAEKQYRTKLGEYKTEEEMADDIRKADVKIILSPPTSVMTDLDEIIEINDYVAQLLINYKDVFLGAWAFIDPRTGLRGVRELERCVKDLGMVGFGTMGTFLGISPNDELFYPFYEVCIEAGVPAFILVGYTALGAGLPGGGGHLLQYCHPVYVDEVAAKFPELTIIASRPAWPWQDEMIAILLHKPNVYNDLHGWSPKYFVPELKREINGRLQDKFMFGADYPMFSYDRLFRDWQSEGYKPEILEKVFYKNAQKILGIEL